MGRSKHSFEYIFRPAINASRAISFQVRSALNSFVNNFQIALKPQIIKSFASGDLDYMHKLVHQGAKYSFFCYLYYLYLFYWKQRLYYVYG